jgi:hypothetical protein
VISAGDEGSITTLRNQPGSPTTGSNADTVRSSNPGSKAPQRGIALPDFKMKTVSAALTRRRDGARYLLEITRRDGVVLS